MVYLDYFLLTLIIVFLLGFLDKIYVAFKHYNYDISEFKYTIGLGFVLLTSSLFWELVRFILFKESFYTNAFIYTKNILDKFLIY